MALEKKISDGIMAAMKAGDAVRRDTLRNVKKAIIEAKKAGPAVGDELPDDQVVKIVNKLAKQGADSAEIYKAQGRGDLYDYEMAQVGVLKEYLPQQLSDDALADALRAVIAETGAQSPADTGRVMGVASKRLAGQADGQRISAKVKELLS